MSSACEVRPVALVGLSGAGKTTMGPLLASRLGCVAIDLDARISARAGCSIVELFAREGEAAFRGLECAELGRAIDEGASVIACGGGIVETPGGRTLLRERCRPVWLEVGIDEAARRVGEAAVERPLLASGGVAERLRAMLLRREWGYAAVAVARIPTDGLSTTEVAERVARALEALARPESAA